MDCFQWLLAIRVLSEISDIKKNKNTYFKTDLRRYIVGIFKIKQESSHKWL